MTKGIIIVTTIHTLIRPEYNYYAFAYICSYSRKFPVVEWYLSGDYPSDGERPPRPLACWAASQGVLHWWRGLRSL